MKKVVVDGKSPHTAKEECLREGKFHGVSVLSEKYKTIIGKYK